MTRQQKVEYALKTVQEARTWYTKAQFMQMVDYLWTGLENAQNIVTDGVPPVTGGVSEQ